MYRCYRCGKLIEDPQTSMFCPSCGGRIFLKVRQEWVRRVKAR